MLLCDNLYIDINWSDWVQSNFSPFHAELGLGGDGHLCVRDVTSFCAATVPSDWQRPWVRIRFVIENYSINN